MRPVRIRCIISTLLAVGLWATSLSARTEIVPVEDVDWEQLNPARGDQSPQAGTLWGDRKAEVPTGFLAKFVDGFSSPPHIHNATYRAVVISGEIHNDHPDAPDTWMPPGSFWTQPKGQVHITSAQGETNIALVEIDFGPYLVQPIQDAYDEGQRPINVDVANLVWVDPKGGAPSTDQPQIAYLWGDLQSGRSNGTFIKLPAGFNGKIHSTGTTFRAVVISGQVTHHGEDDHVLNPGSYFGSSGETAHSLSASAKSETVLYIRTNAAYKVKSS